jgi:hypothetical protein
MKEYLMAAVVVALYAVFVVYNEEFVHKLADYL